MLFHYFVDIKVSQSKLLRKLLRECGFPATWCTKYHEATRFIILITFHMLSIVSVTIYHSTFLPVGKFVKVALTYILEVYTEHL